MTDSKWMTRASPLWGLSIGVSSMAVIGSFGLEYLGNTQPCFLCYLQRWSWLGLLLISIIANARPSLDRLLRVLRTIGIAAILSLGAYHTLLIAGMLEERCTKRNVIQSEQQLFEDFASSKPCNRNNAALTGLPAPAWSFIGAVILMIAPVIIRRQHAYLSNFQ